MRPDTTSNKEMFFLYCIAAIVLSPLWISLGCKNVQRKKYIEKETHRLVLNKAHEQSVAAVDTINFNNEIVNATRARRDSAHATKKLYEEMDFMHSKPSFNDYSINYDNFSVCGKDTFYGMTPQFNIKYAMSDKEFAKAYNQYCEAVKQLEIARRQGKLK